MRAQGPPDPPPDGAGLRALDWLNFFVANLQTGFGPFIAVYLTTHKWTQGQIGVALSVGSAVTMLAQVPGGMLVDALRQKRLAATIGLAAIAASALLLAIWPERLPVMLAQGLHGFASCVLVPAIAAITLNRVGRRAYAERLGRNARFAAIGNAAGAALMGAIGSYVSSRAVFWFAAALSLPALFSVQAMPSRDPPVDPDLAAAIEPREAGRDSIWQVMLDRRLLAFTLCILCFQFANAAMLPVAAAEVTRQAGNRANLIIAACLVVPQAVVALLSPGVGRLAERRGRRFVLLLGFLALPVRGLLLATLASPAMIVASQLLDGVGGAVIGVLLPLVAADLTRGTGRFNLCMGGIGLGVGVGATLSTAMAGDLAGRFGSSVAFLALTFVGAAAVLLVVLAMPETQPASKPVRLTTPPSPGG
ncbi:MAG: MFS transporter [Rhodospirillales bacterium]|nr:MFS transporter [Rhodospirillales bacterium]